MMPTQSGGAAGPLGMTLTPWVKRLMIATAVLSIVGGFTQAWQQVPVGRIFGFTPVEVWGGGVLPVPAVWQLVTYPFFIFEPLGLILSILMYGWFAGTMEAWWGGARFLRFFVLVSVGSVLLTLLVALGWPNAAGAQHLGPLPVLEALIVAYGITFPDRIIRLFFVLPVKGIHLVWLTVGILALYILFSGQLAPFMPQIFGIALGAAVVSGVWKPRRFMLQFKKKRIEWELEKEKRRRRDRTEKADHLRVVEEDDEGKKPPGNGSTGSGGWLH